MNLHPDEVPISKTVLDSLILDLHQAANMLSNWAEAPSSEGEEPTSNPPSLGFQATLKSHELWLEGLDQETASQYLSLCERLDRLEQAISTPSSAEEEQVSSPPWQRDWADQVTTDINVLKQRVRRLEDEPMWCQEPDHNLLVDIRHLLHRMLDRLEPADQLAGSRGEDWSAQDVIGLLKRLSQSSLVSQLVMQEWSPTETTVYFRLTATPTPGESAETATACETRP